MPINTRRSVRGSTGCAVILIIAFIGLLFLLATCVESPKSTSSVEQVRPPQVSIQRVVGSYLNSDGLRMIIIKESYDDTGWNGRLSFSPPVGDWAKTLRCRVSGTDLAVEVPASSGTFIAKLFKLEGPDTISGSISPWEGSFTRVR